MAIHELSVGATDEWYTPPYVFEALGCRFDLDVAMPHTPLSWIPAERSLSSKEDGLFTPWEGMIWMNPPFGGRNGIIPWLAKFCKHANGIALTPDRTSAPWWREFAPRASLILFVSPKIKFIDIYGNTGNSPGTGTSLLGIGKQADDALRRAAKAGLGILTKPEKEL